MVLESVLVSFFYKWLTSFPSEMKVKVKSLSCVWLFTTPWTVAYQAPHSMEFSRQEYWSGLPFPSPVFPVPLVKEIFLSPLHILASFVKDKLSIDVWIYLCAFYLVPLIYISVFVSLSYCLDNSSFIRHSEVRQVDSSSSILLSQDYIGYSRIFCISIQTVKLFVLVPWKIPLVAWYGLHWMNWLIFKLDLNS